MIITRTPFRMSFFGGGTDLKEFFEKYGGSVLSTTFDKYCYVRVREMPAVGKFYEESRISGVKQTTKIKEAEAHPAVRQAVKMMEMRQVNVSRSTDLPERSGLGTSSAFAVGMLHAFYILKGMRPDKRELADDAIYLERVLCREKGGWQDQIAVSFGGLNRINFAPDGYEVIPIPVSPARKERLNRNLMMFFTGSTRFSSEIQKANESEYRRHVEVLKKMMSMVDEAEKILLNHNRSLDDFGFLLDETWQLKKKTGAAISNDAIDVMYEKAMKAGALGGKLLGAGGGGFLLLYVREEKQESVRGALQEFQSVPFRFEEKGTEVIDSGPESHVTGSQSVFPHPAGDISGRADSFF